MKFNSFWTIQLDAGWSLFATHPVNRDDLPFRLLSGLVDADRFYDGGINFPAVLAELAAADYRGWLVVEAEQDPAKARPLAYARLGFAHLSATVARVGLGGER